MSVSCRLSLFNRPLKNGEKTIFIRITLNRKAKYIGLGKSVKEEEWESNTGKALGNSRYIRELNFFLQGEF
jgi:hypothetical protein